MLKHRKRISIFTLAIFMLTLVFSGIAPAFAATKTVPGSAPVAQAPSSSSSSNNDRPNGVSPEGDAVKNSIGQGPKLNAVIEPWLDSLEVFAASTPLQLSPGFAKDVLSYQVTIPGNIGSIDFRINPRVNLGPAGEDTDRIDIFIDDTLSSTNAIPNTDYVLNTSVTLNAAGPDTKIAIKLVNEDNDGRADLTRTYTLTVHRVLPQGASLELPASLEMNLDTPNAYSLTAKVMFGQTEQTYVDGSTFQWEAGPEGVVTVENHKKTVKITPHKVGTTNVTVRIPVDNGEDLVATAQITVGQIVLKVGAPQLKPDGTYTVWFGYENRYPYNINLNLSTTAGLNTGGHIIAGAPPIQLIANANLPEVFQMEYGQSESPPAWAVTYINWTRTVTAGKDPKAYVEVAPSNVELVMGVTMTAQLTATALNGPDLGPTIGSYPEITWESKDTSVATVTSSANGRVGTVTAVGPGQVEIYAYFNGTSAYATVKVLQLLESVSLQLDDTKQLADNAVLLMSEKPHSLKAVIDPATANFPAPMVYEWVVDDPAGSVDIDPEDNDIYIDPNPDNPGTVNVTVNIKDGEGPAAKIFASASATIYVGKIDIWVEKGDPYFNANGSYEASFGYSNTFPVDIDDVDTNSFDGTGEINDGERPSVFKPGTHYKEFRVKYWDDPQTWTVAFEGYSARAVAKTYQSITVDPRFKDVGITDEFDIRAYPSFYGRDDYIYTEEEFQNEIVWQVVAETTPGVIELDAEPNQTTGHVTAKKPGIALIKVSIGNDKSPGEPEPRHKNRKAAYSIVYVHDDRTLVLDKEELIVKRGRTEAVNAIIGYEYDSYDDNYLYKSGFPEELRLPEGWNEVQWGFVAEDENGRYIVDASEYLTLSASGDNMEHGSVTGLNKGKVTVVGYLGNNIYSEIYDCLRELGVPSETLNGLPIEEDEVLYLDEDIPNYRYDTIEVTIKKPVRRVEEEEKAAPQQTTPAPPALETLDVTITVGSNLAMVNDQQITLSGNTLLIGKDRAMVDYADISKLIPGVVVTWDWKTLSVTFTKGDKAVTMKLDEIPAGFDVPFMNIGGRLVVPARYVGAFFGATVDWNGNTLVVHMYK